VALHAEVRFSSLPPLSFLQTFGNFIADQNNIAILLLGIFLIYISDAIPKVPHTLCPTPLPTHSHFLALHSPVLKHIKLARRMGLSFHWWQTRPSFDTYAARDTSSGGGGERYCVVHIVVLPIGLKIPLAPWLLGSSSSIGGPVIHPIADCEHLLLCLLGPRIASPETAISGSFQQNLASVCNGVSVWRLIMGWIPGYGSL
jgi:hypothetical protein